MNEEAPKSPAATNPDAVAAAPEPKPPRRLFSREWAALLFAVVIRDRADHRDDATLPLDPINQGSEEVKLVRELYRQFYLQEKSYLQIAGGIESCQKLYKNDARSFRIAMKKPVVIAVCMLVALAGSGLAAEPLQPEEGPVAEAGEANAAPDTPEAKPEDRADPSESAGKYSRPACPGGPPCRGE